MTTMHTAQDRYPRLRRLRDRLPTIRAGLLALAVLSLTQPVQASTVRVDLSARDRTVRLGEPLRVRVGIENTSGVTFTTDVVFALKRAGGEGPAVPFTRWVGVVPASDRVTMELQVSTGQFFAGRGRFRLLLDPSGDATADPLTFRVTEPRRRPPRFEDISDATGLEATHQAPGFDLSCRWAAGSAWGDIEGDGDLDLYLPHQAGPGQLWVNEGSTFVDRAAERGAEGNGLPAIGAVFADYDNDGDPDLYVTVDGPNLLLRNDGTGHFDDVAAAAGVDDDGPSTSAAWADYDNDGHLDLYVVNYGRCGTENGLEYAPDVLYHANGDGTFSEVTSLLGPPAATLGAGFQAAWFDSDRDGDQDLYLANDFIGPTPSANVLWRNDGPDGGGGWRFTDISSSSGTGYHLNSMGLGLADYDRDRDLDVAVSNIGSTHLFRNGGVGTFADVAGSAGVARPRQTVETISVTWGLVFADLNMDGWEDLYVPAGSLSLEAEHRFQPDALFVNDSRGRFLDMSHPSGTADPLMTRSAALADVDRDGRMDMFVVNQAGPARLLRNVTRWKVDGKRYHWLEVDTVGTRSNRDGCGARVTAKLRKGPTLVRQVFCGSTGLASGSDPTVHFGLGTRKQVRTLTVEWPSGTRQVIPRVGGDRVLTIMEPA
jgi:enediyne biosynthesis protein E4